MSSKASAFPVCGARMIPVLHGFPCKGDWERQKRGEVVLGGCIISATTPDRVCKGDPAHWLRKGTVVEERGGLYL